MKIAIVCYEKGWVLEKIAKNLLNQLIPFYTASVIYDLQLKEEYDVFIHVYFISAVPIDNKINIYFITHVDSYVKIISLIFLSLRPNSHFLCMSKQKKDFLSKVFKEDFVHYYNQKSLNFEKQITVPKQFVFGLFFRLYVDGRKNDYIIDELLLEVSKLNLSHISFVAFGTGYDNLLSKYPDLLSVNNTEFNVESYKKAVKSCDYVISFGKDEGYISVLDAAAAGTKTISVAQGFHLDFKHPEGSLLVDTPGDVFKSVYSIVRASIIPTQEFCVSEILNKILNQGKVSQYKLNKLIINSLTIKNPFHTKYSFKTNTGLLVHFLININRSFLKKYWFYKFFKLDKY